MSNQNNNNIDLSNEIPREEFEGFDKMPGNIPASAYDYNNIFSTSIFDVPVKLKDRLSKAIKLLKES